MIRSARTIEARRFHPDIEAFFIQLMERHGIQVEIQDGYLLITLPEHATKTLRGTYIARATEYMVKLPNGFTLYQSEPHYTRFKSGISFDLHDVPEEIIRSHPRGIHNT